jgi:hypothetical protein
MHKLIVSLLFVILILAAPCIASAQETGDGIIEGQVINDTAGSDNVAGLPVRLIGDVGGNVQIIEITETDTEGNFSFTDIAREYNYLVSVNYMGVDYYSVIVFPSDDVKTFVQIAVCDATTSDEDISVLMAHKIIDFKDTAVNVTEIYVLFNEGDKTFIGTSSGINGEQGILVFNLPEGATSFQAPQEMVDDFILLDNYKVEYAVPFPPGERQLVFTYDIPLEDKAGITIAFPVDYPTDYIDVMVRSDGVEVSTGQLAPDEPVETATGEKYIHFTGLDISHDSIIEIRLDKITDDSFSILITVIGVIAFVIIVSSITIYLLRRNKKQAIAGQNSDSIANE